MYISTAQCTWVLCVCRRAHFCDFTDKNGPCCATSEDKHARQFFKEKFVAFNIRDSSLNFREIRIVMGKHLVCVEQTEIPACRMDMH